MALFFTHGANEMTVYLFIECRTFHEIMLLLFLVTQVLFVRIFSVLSEIGTVEHIENVVCLRYGRHPLTVQHET